MATLAEMVDSMRRAERERRLTERVRYLARHSVLILIVPTVTRIDVTKKSHLKGG